MTSNIKPITELDFDNIKSDIIEHFKADPTFSDYNFEGSALNTLIDILAYNTHSVAYYANMIHNESFLDTAQKRSSVVSIAKELGYTPTSYICSTAYVDVVVSGVDTNLELEIGESFTSSNENGPQIFIVPTNVTGSYADNTVTFSDVKIVNGTRVSNTFTVDTLSNLRSIFTIPNKRIDISTINVYVKSSANSTEKTYYTLSSNIYGATSTDHVFFLQESYDGNYQIYFGENILGVQPTNGNVIIVEYIVAQNTNYADGCTIFSPNFSFNGMTGIKVTTKQKSFGSKEQESIDSIRRNAIKNNTAKNRAITKDDFNIILKNKFPYIKNSIVWGGEENVPPIYGKVFLSLQPVSGYVITEDVKTNVIIPELKKYTMLTIIPVIVDPEYISVEYSTRIKFNKFKTIRSDSDVNILVVDKIKNYMDNLSTFGLSYYHSDLLYQLTDLDPGIISISVKKKIGFNINPLIGENTIFEKIISNSIEASSITSDSFDCLTNDSLYKNCSIKEIPNTKNNNVVDLGLYSTTNVLLSTIGTVNLLSGYFKFNLIVMAYLSAKNYIGIRCELVNDDIRSFNNQILTIDSSINSSIPKNDNLVFLEHYAN